MRCGRIKSGSEKNTSAKSSSRKQGLSLVTPHATSRRLANAARPNQRRKLYQADLSWCCVELSSFSRATTGARLALLTLCSPDIWCLQDCPIAIADLQVFDIWGLNDRPALLIGMNWLRHFKRVEVDYGRKDFRFEIGSANFNITA